MPRWCCETAEFDWRLPAGFVELGPGVSSGFAATYEVAVIITSPPSELVDVYVAVTGVSTSEGFEEGGANVDVVEVNPGVVVDDTEGGVANLEDEVGSLAVSLSVVAVDLDLSLVLVGIGVETTPPFPESVETLPVVVLPPSRLAN